MRIQSTAVLAAVLLQGCASSIALKTPFNENDFAAAQAPGANALQGMASMVSGDGLVRTCAGQEVVLVPDIAYTRERMPYLYGSLDGGYLPARLPLIHFRGETYRYGEMVRKTYCDVEGRFRFSRAPDGDYFVIAEVMWRDPGDSLSEPPRGGRIMKPVRLEGGATAALYLHW
jgi:hypothetical protein